MRSNTRECASSSRIDRVVQSSLLVLADAVVGPAILQNSVGVGAGCGGGWQQMSLPCWCWRRRWWGPRSCRALRVWVQVEVWWLGTDESSLLVLAEAVVGPAVLQSSAGVGAGGGVVVGNR